MEALFERLTPTQVQFVIARLRAPTDKAAAAAIGVKAKTVYNWPAETKALIRRAIALCLVDTVEASRRLLRAFVLEATEVKIAGLTAPDVQARQAAATEILDRVLGRARQAVDLDVGEVHVKGYVQVSPEMWDE